MKIVILSFILLPFLSKAQTITPQVKAAAGTTFQNSTAQISFTIGEPITNTLTSSSNIVTQGYQQPKVNINITGIEPVSEPNKFTYFPQPSSNILIVRSDENIAGYKINLFDNNAQEVFRESFNNSQASIDVSSFRDGIYVIEVTDEKNNIVSKGQVSIIHK